MEEELQPHLDTLPVRTVAVVGAGPRGLSVVERICANASSVAPGRPIHVHVVDPFPAGAGRVWRTNQSRELLMNTVASQITVFTDDSVDCAGPVAEGPSLYEWARFFLFTGQLDHDPGVQQEAKCLGPDSYPTRAFYGAYLRWAFEHVVSTAPKQVRVTVWRTTATRVMDRPDGSQTLELAEGGPLTGLDAVILAQGHLDCEPTKAEADLAHFARDSGSLYLPPQNPAEADLSAIFPGAVVALRGLGLNFFDYMTLLTEGRGGTYQPYGDHLVYEPSGEEPVLIAGSRRGIPYHARGENQKGVSERHEPIFLTPDVIEAFRRRAEKGEGVVFLRDVWPLIDREVRAAYYAALLARRTCGCEAAKFIERYSRVAGTENERTVLRDHGIGAGDQWDWDRVNHPHSGLSFDGIDDFNRWLVGHLLDDAAQAAQGNVSNPLKAALDVLRDLRNEVRLVVDHQGITGPSYRDDLDQWYTPMNAFLSIGPPRTRILEMAALVEAGILKLVGPGMRISTNTVTGRFDVASDLTGDRPLATSVVIEARLPEADVRRTRDPLLCNLLGSGGCRPYHIGEPSGPGYLTGAVAIGPCPYPVLDADDRPHPARYAFGVPTEHVHWVTAAGIRPGVNSVTLADADAIARAALRTGDRQMVDHIPVPTSPGVPGGAR
ncbi:FAD/NAD(P)-binding protein [Streptomyces sp. NPDC005355]|uniref:FAD/NAD(P)-binding protein n=1 Tax=Streptomyces sp. NPDC005355 TaxID=3157038 RepID=UPI0033A828A0